MEPRLAAAAAVDLMHPLALALQSTCSASIRPILRLVNAVRHLMSHERHDDNQPGNGP
jgi:hypothetical protein